MRVLVVAGCLVLALLIAGVAFWQMRGDASRAGAAGGPEPSARPPSVASPAPTAQATEVSEEPGDPSLPLTELPLRLVATVVRENPRLSLATVEDLERDAHEVLNQGQSFHGHPQASLVSIERGRVILDNDGVREQLLLDRADRGPLADVVPYEPTPEQREYRRGLARRLRDITDAGEDYLDRGQRTGLLADGDVSPVYEDGTLVGVRVDNVRADGIYDRFGIRNGDVVTSINGIEMGSPTAAAEVLSEVALSDVLEVELQPQGDGPRQLIEVPTEELHAFDLPPAN